MYDFIHKLSFRWQISIMTAIALLVSLIIMGFFTFRQSRSVIIEQTKDAMMAETNQAAGRVEQILKATRADTVATPNFPPIPGMIRCWDNNGQDPKQIGSTTEDWINRLQDILREQMNVHRIRLHCDVYDHKRQAVMRVFRDGEKLSMQTEDLPSAPATTDGFFERTKDLGKPRLIYVSPMELVNDRPNVRVCTPFYAENEKGTTTEFRGVFVITLDGQKLLEYATGAIGEDLSQPSRAESAEDGGKTYWTDIVDESGVYLYSEDTVDLANLFSEAAEHKYVIKKPVRAELLLEKNPDGTFVRENDTSGLFIRGSQRDGASLIATYRRVYYNAPEDESRFWAIAASENDETALAPLTELRKGFLLLGLLVLVGAGIITYFAAGGLTSSLKTLTHAADQIARGDLNAEMPVVRPSGEVSKLDSSFRAMRENLRTTIEEVRNQESRTNAILDSTADSIVTIDEQGTIVSSNAATERIFGHSNGDIIGQKASILSSTLYDENANYDENAHYKQTDLAPEKIRSLGPESEVSGRRNDGSVIPIAMRVTEMNYGGEKLFIATIQDITSRKQAEDERRKLFDAVRDAVGRLASASQQILATTTEQAVGVQQQASSVTETVATAEQISQTAQQSVERANQLSESARRTDQIGIAGKEAIERSIEAMREVKEQVESLAENILSLADRAQLIGDITSSVKDIAEQTNVLALNAAVEASRAGEHGKGFAVVASEVKSLAEQSKKATSQVRQILGEIQQATNHAVLSTENGTRAVSSASEVIAKAGETINTLATTIADSARTGTQIAASANQQAAGVGQLHEGIRNIDTVTRQSLEAIRQVEAAAQNLTALSNELASLVN